MVWTAVESAGELLRRRCGCGRPPRTHRELQSSGVELEPIQSNPAAITGRLSTLKPLAFTGGRPVKTSWHGPRIYRSFEEERTQAAASRSATATPRHRCITATPVTVDRRGLDWTGRNRRRRALDRRRGGRGRSPAGHGTAVPPRTWRRGVAWTGKPRGSLLGAITVFTHTTYIREF